MKIQIGEHQIRKLRMDDAPAIAKYANNRQISINMRDQFLYAKIKDDL
jgi:hypothetical protein